MQNISNHFEKHLLVIIASNWKQMFHTNCGFIHMTEQYSVKQLCKNMAEIAWVLCQVKGVHLQRWHIAGKAGLSVRDRSGDCHGPGS